MFSHRRKLEVPSRFILVALGFWACFLNHAQRVNLSVAIVAMVEDPVDRENTTGGECFPASKTKPPNLKSSLPFWGENLPNHRINWDHETQALVLSSYYYGYVATQVIGGRLAEIVGAKWMYFAGILGSSLLCLASPLAAVVHPILFVVLRVVQGLMMGAVFPLFHILLSKWIPASERNFSAAIVYGGLSVGNVCGLLFSGLFCQSELLGGWPSSFYVFGIIGLVWCLLWVYFVYETPGTHPRISTDEFKYITSEIDTGDELDEVSKVPWTHVFSSPPIWALICAHVGHSWGSDTLLLELPTYMHEVMGVDIGNTGLILAIPFTLQALSSFISAFVMDKLIVSQIVSKEKARKGCNSVAFFGAAICLISLTLLGCNYTWAIILLCLSMMFDGISKSGFFVNHMDVAPEFAGTLLGITNTVGSIDGFLVPHLVAFLTNGQASLRHWNGVFVVAGIVYLMTGIIFLVFGSTKKLPWASSNINRPLILSESIAKQ